MTIQYKTLSEQLYADSDYLTKLANKPSMREYCQEIINATVDINRAAFQIKQQKKTGHWKYVQNDNNPDIGKLYCSECNRIASFEYNYCPNCGARMVEPQESKEDEEWEN